VELLNQSFRLEAIAAMVSLFDGKPQGTPEYSVIHVGDYSELTAGRSRTELGLVNRLLPNKDKLRANGRIVQNRSQT
jgi:hypothetical protein